MALQRFGSYQLLERLGSGGMGEVYLARLEREQGFEKLLALKRIRPELSGQSRFRELFAAEARLSAGLSHPHIVAVTDFGRQGDEFYLVMEYIDGLDLAALSAAARRAGRRVPLDFALAVGLACLRALDHAHGQSEPVIHGDVCPANVLVGRQGQIKLTDFGLARLAALPGATTAGHPAYLAPEVALGQPPGPAADQFGAAAVLYELLGGRPPHPPQAEPTAALEQARRGLVEPAGSLRPDLPPALSGTLDRALDPEPDRRFAAVAGLEDALERIQKALGLDGGPRPVERFLADWAPERTPGRDATQGGTVVAAGGVGRPRRQAGRWKTAAGAALVLALVLAGGWWLLSAPARLEPPASPASAPPRTPTRILTQTPAPTPTSTRGAAGEVTAGADRPPLPVVSAARKPPPPAARPKPPLEEAEGGSVRPRAGLEEVPDQVEAEPDRPVSAEAASWISAPGPLRWRLGAGREHGEALAQAPLEPGRRLLELSTPGGLQASLRLEVPAGGGEMGLAVRSSPFAILRIDGQPRGTTPIGGLELAPGDHRLVLAAIDHGGSLELQLHVARAVAQAR